MSRTVTVIGAGISGLVAAWRLAERGVAVDVLEADDRPGGTATTDHVAGFAIDRGANAFLTHQPDAYELACAVGLEDKIVESSSNAGRRFLVKDGRLVQVPKGLIASDMLGLPGMVRALLEFSVTRRASEEDESVYSFMSRRFGSRVADLLAFPMVAGVTAGDASVTSCSALFPRLSEFEHEFGGVLKGVLRRRGEPRAKLMTVRGGIGQITDALADRLGPRLRLSTRVERVYRSADTGRWVVEVADGTVHTSDAIVVATPSHVAASIVGRDLPVLSAALDEIPYAGVRVVTLAFRRDRVGHALDGFGFLVPRGESLRTLGCVWVSSAFPDRAPEGCVLLRVMLGGVLDPGALDLSDHEAERLALDEVGALIGFSGEPEFVHHVVWRAAIPQYELGHASRVRTIRELEGEAPGLFLTGNAYDGVSMNESIGAATRAAERVSAALESDRLSADSPTR